MANFHVIVVLLCVCVIPAAFEGCVMFRAVTMSCGSNVIEGDVSKVQVLIVQGNGMVKVRNARESDAIVICRQAPCMANATCKLIITSCAMLINE